VGFVLEAGMTFNLVRTAFGLAGKRTKPVNTGLIALFLLFCISFSIGLTIYVQSRILNWMNTTYTVMVFSVFLIVIPALFISAFSRLPEKHRIKKSVIRMFVILYILKYGLLALEPVWGRPLGMASGALLLILANLIPLYWLKHWFVKTCSEGIDAETRRKLSAFVQAYGISSRELEIIELILKGKSNKEIEDLLFISFSTVKNHIYHIYQKMGINSRGQLMAMVINHSDEHN